MLTSMVSIIVALMIMIGGNPGNINRQAVVPDPTAANPTDFEREWNIFLDHLDNITRIDETKNGETTQITTEIPFDTDFMKLNQYSRFDQWGLSYDKNGNLTQKGTQKMYHDYKNQMVRVTEGTTNTTENKYDALGRRLQMIVTTGSQAKTDNYYYAVHQLVEVRDGSDQVKRQFIYGNGIDEVVRMDAYNGSTITSYYLHTNEIGSTTAVTDANGNVVELYKYGLYGNPTFMNAAGNIIPKSAIGNNILFQGREYEPETNLYYFRARHYDPIMGRFLQVDPMGYQDSLNLYQGLNMNPVNFVDPMGLQEKEFYAMSIANRGDLDRIQYLQAQARKGYAKGAFAAAATFALSPFSAPTIIALCGSGLIYKGLEEYSDRRMAGQSKLEAKTGAVVDTLTLGTYPIFSGRDAGTGDIVSGEQKLKIVSDLIPTTIGGAAGIVSGSLFSRLNPSTSQLIDDAFRVLDFQRTSTGYVAVTDGTTSNLPVLHGDQIIINNYQRYYNEAWINVIKRFNAEEISIPSGLNWKTYLGQIADKYARNRLKNFLKREGIAEGPGMDVLVNRWLRDPMGSGKYRIPDVKLEQTGIILDGTIGNKTVNTPQIQDFIKFSIGNKVIIIRPKVK